jgi:NAD(P)-dependent dehydrogenase (short-subunit alcohol dehydrogenase family)
MNIQDATALVTGANRGIGQEIVRALVASGIKKVYAGARDIRNLDATLSIDPKRIVPLVIDVTDRDRVAALPSEAPDVTLLINNAGVLDFGTILDLSLDAIDRDFAVNFYGKLLMARAFAPVIERNGGGAIANLLTLLALVSMPGLAAYNASKAAAWSMTQSLRASLAGKSIKVHSVFPGAVDTDMLAGFEFPKERTNVVGRAIVDGIADGREDIFPDLTAVQVYTAWRMDHKAVEKQYASY